MSGHFTLKRVHCPENLAPSAHIAIDTHKSHHLTNVLRARIGDQLRLFNERDGEWLAQIDQIDKHKLHLITLKQIRTKSSAGDSHVKHENDQVSVSLIFAPIKPDRLHFMIEKATELGVDRLVPILTERAIIRFVNTEKITTYLTQAAEQSERLSLPKLLPLTTLEAFLKTLGENDIVVFCNEQETEKSLNKLAIDKSKNYHVLIGPEGGFTNKEEQVLKAHQQVISVHIGPQILRTETAALFAISCLQFTFGHISSPPRT